MEAEQFGLLWLVTALRKERMARVRMAKERMVKGRVRARRARLHLSHLQRALVPWLSRQASSNLLILTTMMHRPKRKPRLLLMTLMILSKLYCSCSCSDAFCYPLGLGEVPSEGLMQSD